MALIHEKLHVTPNRVNSSIITFTDGASSGNPGPGGWGSILVFPDGKVVELGGSDPKTTNNRMEILAAIKALRYIQEQHLHTPPAEAIPVTIYTDSVYLIRGITQWIWGWRKRKWLKAEGGEVANPDLWEELFQLAMRQKRQGEISWRYVRGHSGIPGNERADEIAVAFSQRRRLELYQGSLLKYPIPILDIPENTDLPQSARESISGGAKKKPHSYLSLVGRTAMRHSSWADCESRVKGQSGARFKKAMSPEEESEILRAWGIHESELKN